MANQSSQPSHPPRGEKREVSCRQGRGSDNVVVVVVDACRSHSPVGGIAACNDVDGAYSPVTYNYNYIVMNDDRVPSHEASQISRSCNH